MAFSPIIIAGNFSTLNLPTITSTEERLLSIAIGMSIISLPYFSFASESIRDQTF